MKFISQLQIMCGQNSVKWIMYTTNGYYEQQFYCSTLTIMIQSTLRYIDYRYSRQSGGCSSWWSIAVFVRCGIACWRLWAQYQWHILLLLFRNRAVVVYALHIMVTWKLHDVRRESIAIVKFLYHHFSCTVVREPLLRVESSFVCHSFH